MAQAVWYLLDILALLVPNVAMANETKIHLVENPFSTPYGIAWCEKTGGYEFVLPVKTISDGFGNSWDATCQCGGELSIVRPGKVQCNKCG